MRFKMLDWKIQARATPRPGMVVRVSLVPVSDFDPNCRLAISGLHPKVTLATNGGSELADVRVEECTSAFLPYDGHFPIELFVDTPFALLERLEHGRTDPADVRLEIDLRATIRTYFAHTIHDPKQGQRLVHSLAYPPTPLVAQHAIGGCRHTIHRDEWLAVLRQLRFTDVLVVELPARPLDATCTTDFVRAYGCLESARRSFDDHRYAHVCVDVCEALEHLAPDHKNHIWEHLTTKFFKEDTMCLRDRVTEMLIKLAPVIHLGRHAGKSEEERRTEVTREHAAFLLGVGQLLVGWCRGQVG